MKNISKVIELSPGESATIRGNKVIITSSTFSIGDTITDGDIVFTITSIDQNTYHSDYIYYVNDDHIWISDHRLNIDSKYQAVTDQRVITKLRSILSSFKYVITSDGRLLSYNLSNSVGSNSPMPLDTWVLVTLKTGNRFIARFDGIDIDEYYDDNNITPDDVLYWNYLNNISEFK